MLFHIFILAAAPCSCPRGRSWVQAFHLMMMFDLGILGSMFCLASLRAKRPSCIRCPHAPLFGRIKHCKCVVNHLEGGSLWWCNAMGNMRSGIQRVAPFWLPSKPTKAQTAKGGSRRSEVAGGGVADPGASAEVLGEGPVPARALGPIL